MSADRLARRCPRFSPRVKYKVLPEKIASGSLLLTSEAMIPLVALRTAS